MPYLHLPPGPAEGVAGGGAGDAQVDSVVLNGTSAVDRMRLRADSHGVVSLRRRTGAVRIEDAEPTDILTVNGIGGDEIHAAPYVWGEPTTGSQP